MEQSPAQPSSRFRVFLVVDALILLALWAASAIPLVQNWNNPNEDGFSAVPLFWASLTFLPLGISVLLGAVSASESGLRRARLHARVGVVMVGLVIALEILRRILNAMDG